MYAKIFKNVKPNFANGKILYIYPVNHVSRVIVLDPSKKLVTPDFTTYGAKSEYVFNEKSHTYCVKGDKFSYRDVMGWDAEYYPNGFCSGEY